MGRGLLFADKIVAVNRNYDDDDSLPEPARFLQPALISRLKSGDLEGINNGIDYQEFDPSSDSQLTKGFSEHSIPNRVHNKRALQEEIGFARDDGIPLLGMVSRLIPAKGIELIFDLKETPSRTSRNQKRKKASRKGAKTRRIRKEFSLRCLCGSAALREIFLLFLHRFHFKETIKLGKSPIHRFGRAWNLQLHEKAG